MQKIASSFNLILKPVLCSSNSLGSFFVTLVQRHIRFLRNNAIYLENSRVSQTPHNSRYNGILDLRFFQSTDAD